MKILHVTAGIQETCGVSRFVVECARSQMAAGHEVCIVTAMTCGYPTGDIDVRLLNDPAGIDFVPDIVHLHSTWNWYIHQMAKWARGKHIPYMVSPHGALTPWALRYRWWKKLPALLLYQYYDLVKAEAFHVTVQSEAAHIRRLKLIAPIIIAPLATDICGSGHLSKEKVILFLGRVHPVKGLDILLQAWNSIPPSKRSHWRLIIAGPDDIDYKRELIASAKTYGLRVADFSDDLQYGKKTILGGGEVPVSVYKEQLQACAADIIFTGPVYSEAKNFLYQSAKYFVLPSFSENFGAVVIEALAAGTPAITTTGTPWEALAREKCGWWIPPKSEELSATMLEAIQMEESDYDQMSQRALAFVEKRYSWDRSAEILTDAYQRILEKK